MGTTTETRPVPLLETIGADDLVAKEMPPISMVVGNVIPAGLFLLAGDPKAGKSLLLQDLSLSVATGKRAWGAFDVPTGDVLYIANEGGERSFRDRVVKMLDGREAPGRLRIGETREPLGGRLEVQLETWLVGAEEPRLVVIDTYTSVAPDTRGVNRHQEDYNALAGLATLANAHPDLLLVVVHHTNKSEQTDVMHRISGSQGMTAVTDGNAVLSRHTASNRSVLSIRPRNAPESDLLLERHPERLTWSVVADNERAMLSGSRQDVLTWVEENGATTAKAVAAALGMNEDTARQVLGRMADDGQILRLKRGTYAPVSHESRASQDG